MPNCVSRWKEKIVDPDEKKTHVQYSDEKKNAYPDETKNAYTDKKKKCIFGEKEKNADPDPTGLTRMISTVLRWNPMYSICTLFVFNMYFVWIQSFIGTAFSFIDLERK